MIRVPYNESAILLAHVTHKPKEFLYAHPDHPLTPTQQKKFNELVQRRQAGEPIAYLTGHKEFYGLDFLVNKHVLIPRPDTELLVETVVDYCRQKNLTIVDIGTGSGNIAITLKKLLPRAQVIATDISAPALTVMKKNCQQHQVTIPTYRGNGLAALPKKLQHTLDIIVCNAPYLTKTEARKTGLAYEPQVALTPPGAPTSIIQTVIEQSASWLKPQGVMLFEIGHRQAAQVKKLCLRTYPHAKITIHKDLGGFDRVVMCRTS